MRSYVFASDKFCMNAGIDGDSSHDGTVMNEADYFQSTYDEYPSDEDHIVLLQQREFINSLFYKRDFFNEDKTTMSEDDKFGNERDCFNEASDDEFFINADDEKLFLINGQVRSDGKIAEVFVEMGNQNSILMKTEEIVKSRFPDCGMN